MPLKFVLSLAMLLSLAPIVWGQDERLPPCESADLDTLLDINAAYKAVMAQAIETKTSEQLPLLGYKQYRWRIDMLSQLPSCAEAIEIGWLMNQVSGDAVAVISLKVANIKMNWIAIPMLHTRSNIEVLLGDLTALVETRQLRTVSLEENVNEDEFDQTCSETELDLLAPGILMEYQHLFTTGLEVDTGQQYLDYATAQFEWRDRLWEKLPHCQEALDFGMLMSQISGDLIAMYAYKLAGISDQNNPGKIQVDVDTRRFSLLREEIIAALDRGRTVATYYVSANGNVNVRSCGSTECDIVTRFRRGDELRVIDDSGDWYEIRLADGRIAYVAGFLASVERPN